MGHGKECARFFMPLWHGEAVMIVDDVTIVEGA